ncbi:MAG: hypothetical protein JWO30_3421 [Fibrobacteres bacterium]|nr:hypothetical protein [Fibrobacterota bacterium]
MHTSVKLLFLCAAAGIARQASAATAIQAVTHACRPIADEIKIDGVLDEPQWQGLDTLRLMLNNAPAGGKPTVETKVLTAWSQTRLYVAYIVSAKNVKNTTTQHDADAMYSQDVVEMFIDPDGDGKNYFELEWNCLNTSLDFFFTAPLQGQDKSWAPQGMQNAVKVHGTANNPVDVDTGMVVEISLPWAAFKQWSKGSMPPKAGDSLALNFYRINYITPSTPELISWAPTGAADFHRPDKFGALIFSSQPVTSLFPKPDPRRHASAGGFPAPARRVDGRRSPSDGWGKVWLFQVAP